MKTDGIRSRRDFVRAAARWALLAGITGGVLALTDRRGGRCDVAPACRVCGRWAQCDLPDAARARAGHVQGAR